MSRVALFFRHLLCKSICAAMFLHLHLSNLAKHDRVINCIDGSAVGR